MLRKLRGALLAIALLAAPTLGVTAPKFPALTGRVVDQANILSPGVESELTGKLAALETQTGRQLVVVTVPSLQDYPIEDFGYQLGRSWGIGDAKADNGALFIVAPNERKVRIEVGYGLEPVLTDALSSIILQTAVLPRFKAGDMEGGVVAGVDAIAGQLALPPEEARARAQQATSQGAKSSSGGLGIAPILVLLAIFFLFSAMGGRGRRGGLGGVLPGIILGSMLNSRGGGGRFGGGGGGGFGGGGGGFGGGGSSGSW